MSARDNDPKQTFKTNSPVYNVKVSEIRADLEAGKHAWDK